jgi:hypothetical protein
MAELKVKSATVADGTFSGTGATVWDAGMDPVAGTILSTAFGGTGVTSGLDGGLLYWSSSTTIADVGPFAAGALLIGDGAAAPPTSLSLGTALQQLRVDAAGTALEYFTPAASGGSTLDGITAATADQAGISNGDWNIRWNWQKTTNSEVAFEFGESAASTGGTSSSGIPNQVIGKFSTVANSTASPLSVWSRATHVFSVSPTVPQILANDGTNSNPTYGFASDIDSGVYYASGVVTAFGGVPKMTVAASVSFNAQARAQNGTAAAPGWTFANFPDTGFWTAAGAIIGVAVNGAESARYTSAGYIFGASAAVATTAVGPFLYINSCAGTPTGVPTSAATGAIPMLYDTTSNTIWFYNGSWRGVAVA